MLARRALALVMMIGRGMSQDMRLTADEAKPHNPLKGPVLDSI